MKTKTLTGKFQLVGTGSSSGVPAIGCSCEVCRSDDPHNSRLRSAAVVRVADRTLIIDVGPDFRQQALTYGVDHVDGVLITHVHYDHTAGIDDLRAYYLWSRKPVPFLASTATLADLQERCSYLFASREEGNSLTAQLQLVRLEEERGTVLFSGLPVQFVTFYQGGMPVNGFRFGDCAYISDIKEYPETIFEDLAGIKTLVISALRHSSSFLHFAVADAVAFAERVGAEQTWITHICHELDHKTTNASLPSKIQLAHDGLEFAFSIDIPCGDSP